MKKISLVIFYIFFLSHAYTQANRVFAGGEAISFGTVDISLNSKKNWSTQRSNHPGYFSLMNKANYIGYSDHANIDGYIKKYGNTAFVFPVGTGKDLRILEMSNPAEITDAYATSWIEGDPGNSFDPTAPYAGKHAAEAVAGPIAAVSKAGQWDWQVGDEGNLGTGTTGCGDSLLITVSIPDMTAFANEFELRLVGWNGSSWIDLSGRPTATGNKENSQLSGIMIPGISAIAIGKVASIPFAHLKSIRAISSQCNLMLQWETSFENNVSTFTIEQSLNGFDFQPITSISILSSSVGNIYNKQIDQPFVLAYYRVKVNNSNGAFLYSPVVLYNNKCNEIGDMQIYPNPLVDNENLHLRLTTAYEGDADLILFNSIGQIVFSQSIQINQGLNLLTPDIKNLNHGNYSIKILGSKGEQIIPVKQFIKQ